MDTTVEALRKLYVSLGGNIENVESLVVIPDLINAIAELDTKSGLIVTHDGNGNVVIH